MSKAARKKPMGHTGVWWADWQGKRLPCIHQQFMTKSREKGAIWHYSDPELLLNSPYHSDAVADRFVSAFAGGEALVDTEWAPGVTIERKGYLAHVRVTPMQRTEFGGELEVTEIIHRF